MKKLVLLLLLVTTSIQAQQVDLSYYLPKDVSYNKSIPTPKSVIGHEVGEWHITHDKLTEYMKALAKASDRISLENRGTTFEGRPLLLLTITSPSNHQKLETIRKRHIDATNNASVDVSNDPIVVYQGFSIHGNEASGSNAALAAAYYLAQSGAKVVGIIDRAGGLINEEGFSFEEIKELFNSKDGNQLKSDKLEQFDSINERIWDLNADIFVPCAASRLITKNQVERMIAAGMQVVSAGANVPFADPEIFFGPIADFADKNLSIIPDFISNCGMARVFAYLMSSEAVMEDEAIFKDTSEIIKNAMEEVYAKSSDKTNISNTAFEIALNKLL